MKSFWSLLIAVSAVATANVASGEVTRTKNGMWIPTESTFSEFIQAYGDLFKCTGTSYKICTAKKPVSSVDLCPRKTECLSAEVHFGNDRIELVANAISWKQFDALMKRSDWLYGEASAVEKPTQDIDARQAGFFSDVTEYTWPEEPGLTITHLAIGQGTGKPVVMTYKISYSFTK